MIQAAAQGPGLGSVASEMEKIHTSGYTLEVDQLSMLITGM